MRPPTLLGLLAAFLAAAPATAHMAMVHPPPLKGKNNPNSGGDIDFSMTSPLSASGADFPCKGYLSLLGTSAGKPVATWAPGGSYNMTIEGGAAHGGGSCQAALSVDRGKTFRVLHSYVGSCPLQGSSSFRFTLPNDTPRTDEAVFAWTWFNTIGNREMYMNCAVVTVGGGGRGIKMAKRGPSDSFSSRPTIFTANIGNGCTTVESSDVIFPNPGPDVDVKSTKSAPPTGACGATSGSGSGNGSGARPGSGSGSGSGSSGEGSSSSSSALASSASAGTSVTSRSTSSTSTMVTMMPSSSTTTTASSMSSSMSSSPAGDGGVFVTSQPAATATSPSISASSMPMSMLPMPPSISSSGISTMTMLTIIPIASGDTVPSSSTAMPIMSVPGGIFVPGRNGTRVFPTGGGAPAAPSPSIMSTMTKPAATPATPATPTNVPPPAAGGSDSTGMIMAAGETCTSEGMWNCVPGGTGFQRCASGRWSTVIPMDGGTVCKVGMADSLSYAGSGAPVRMRIVRPRRR